MGEMSNKTDIPTASLVEALLFVAPLPVAISQIARTLNMKPKEIDNALKDLGNYYQNGRGLRIQWHKSKVQITTSPELSPIIEEFLGLNIKTTLSRAALETLAIIAYKQPITRPFIDEIRGVNSDGVLRTLLSKGLIQEEGRLEGVGRPILFGTAPEFLQYFGLNSLEELPAFDLFFNKQENNNANGILKD